MLKSKSIQFYLKETKLPPQERLNVFLQRYGFTRLAVSGGEYVLYWLYKFQLQTSYRRLYTIERFSIATAPHCSGHYHSHIIG